MNREQYKEKLRRFNSTEKYGREMVLLSSLLRMIPDKPASVLDYGCGTGLLMGFVKEENKAETYGYDIDSQLYEGDPFYFRDRMFFQVDAVYFMHSIAHLPDAFGTLSEIREKFLKSRGHVVVITPNLDYIKSIDNPDYIPDPTVERHFDLITLSTLLIEAGFDIVAEGQFGESEVFGGAVVNERIFCIARS